MRILFLTHHWNRNTHHSRNSGYQELVKYAARIHDCTVITYGTSTQVANEDGITVHYVKPAMRKDYFFVKRLTISWYASKIEKQFDVVHALYSDCGFFQRHPKFFSTFHISPFVTQGEKLISKLFLAAKYFLIEKRVFSRSRKIFTVSTNLQHTFSPHKKKMVFLPHGVNTGYWSPEISTVVVAAVAGKRYVLCVGNNGIDFTALEAVVRAFPCVIFVFVGVRQFCGTLPNVILLKGIKDEELKSLYMNCQLFIRPMTFATANNSILEAMSMGVPVLISTPAGLYDYFDDSVPFLKTVRSVDFTEAFGREISDEKFVRPREAYMELRQFTIDNYDWKVILKNMISYYNL